MTARDWQGQARALRPGETGDGQWLRAKGSDTFLPLGPCWSRPTSSATARGLKSALADGGRRARRRQAVPMQDGNTSDMLFGVAELISIISQEVTLDPGDVVITGTPSGVGVFRIRRSSSNRAI